MTFVMAEGPYRGEHPVEAVVLYLGQKEQISLDIDGGACRMIDKEQGFAIAQCSATTGTQADGKYLFLRSSAVLQKPIPLEIGLALQ